MTTVISNTDSFFNMFYKEKSSLIKDDQEARFLKEDYLPNILEYYLNYVPNEVKNERKNNKGEELKKI